MVNYNLKNYYKIIDIVIVLINLLRFFFLLQGNDGVNGILG